MSDYYKLMNDIYVVERFLSTKVNDNIFLPYEKEKIISEMEALVKKTELREISLPNNNKLLIKLEGSNGFSVKLRTVLGLLVGGIIDDKIKRNTIIAESSSGNTAIAEGYIVRKVLSKYGVKFSAIIDNRILSDDPNSKGAKIEQLADELKVFATTPKDPSAVYSRLNCVEKLKDDENYFIPDQYDNKNAIFGSYHYLASEIDSQLIDIGISWKNIDYIVNAISTGAHSIGVGLFAKQRNPNIKLIATEQQGSAILSDSFYISDAVPVPYYVGGAGHRYPTKNVLQSLKSDFFWESCAKVSDLAAFTSSFNYNEKYSMSIGPSAGMNIAVVEEIAKTVSNKNFLIIAADNMRDYPTLNSWDKIEKKYRENYEKYGEKYHYFLNTKVSFSKTYCFEKAKQLNDSYSEIVRNF